MWIPLVVGEVGGLLLALGLDLATQFPCSPSSYSTSLDYAKCSLSWVRSGAEHLCWILIQSIFRIWIRKRPNKIECSKKSHYMFEIVNFICYKIYPDCKVSRKTEL